MLTGVTPADLLMEQPTKSDSVVTYSPTAAPSRARLRPRPSCGPTRPTQPIVATPSHLPIGRPVEPTEVADLVVFLASRRAGAIIPINGGSAEGLY
jgi:NAD(P)-dependent dehydrogenase (short-subunit alcohol dehydrogenase family)